LGSALQEVTWDYLVPLSVEMNVDGGLCLESDFWG
jgi:hypothetical protein